jgi:low affinity Fe/Cu permease
MIVRNAGFQERFARLAATWAGSSTAFTLAVGIILLWAVTGPIYGYSDTWQLVINTSTTIITFLMVFLIQRSQNKDGLAVQLKLNELVAAVKGASNRLINIEDLSEQEVAELRARFENLVRVAGRRSEPGCSLSVETAQPEAAAVASAALDVQAAIRRHRRAIRKLRRTLAASGTIAHASMSVSDSGRIRSRA